MFHAARHHEKVRGGIAPSPHSSVLTVELRVDQRQVRLFAGPLHLTEQHSASDVQVAPTGEQLPVAQSGSAASIRPSQSLSSPSEQVGPDSLDGGWPQSAGQVHCVSPIEPLQVPSPQAGADPQSISQLKLSSAPLQLPSPQQ